MFTAYKWATYVISGGPIASLNDSPVVPRHHGPTGVAISEPVEYKVQQKAIITVENGKFGTACDPANGSC